MSWGKREQIAVLRTIALIMRADYETAPEEVAFMEKFLHNFGMSSSDIREARQMSNEEMSRIISNFTAVEKEALKAYWVATAKADGKILDSECEQIEILSHMCDIRF